MSVFFGQYDKTAQTNGATKGNGELPRLDEETFVTPIPTAAEREATISALARQLTQGTLTGQVVDVFAPTRSEVSIPPLRNSILENGFKVFLV